MNRKTLTRVATLVAAVSIVAAILFNGAQMRAARTHHMESMANDKHPIQLQEVSVIEALAQRHQAMIVGYGEAKSQFELELVAEVSGQLTALSNHFKTGAVFAKGQQLAQINPLSYQQAVADAQVALADAQLALLEEQRLGEQAELEWQRSGMTGDPDSPLVLRKPQLAAAEATLQLAQKQLASAEYDLAQTRISAPFDAVVVSREVQPGRYLQTGETIATLYSTDRIEVAVPLSEQQWQNLPVLANESAPSDALIAVTLLSNDKQRQWQGYIERTELHLDETSRQRSVVVVVDEPLSQPTPLMAGEFVTAQIEGRVVDGLWQLPASAISQAGEIWYVQTSADGKEQLLANTQAEQQFAHGEYVYVRPVAGLTQALVVARPLITYVAGMRVHAQVEPTL
ncbi:efflux RND transporter periplasmic adaptor subunit [Neiella marina]|uniref:Efflux RND transporter periplasmic adaptor subunit n=1 Tax=Neiella holothuriorum TaxID=2870530 RepID=A0ABS7EBX4_9GAMM|nr:efflux RND transporter periplasmic adaptor subunit [Neiella holothuriorum]MBW8189740.1 efflux RND transporter periplasmic adaptor subunit [Neiella holothuriorum]